MTVDTGKLNGFNPQLWYKKEAVNDNQFIGPQPRNLRKYGLANGTLEQNLANIDNKSLIPNVDSPTLRAIGWG